MYFVQFGMESKKLVKNVISQIDEIRKTSEREIKELKEIMFAEVKNFSTYFELYCFVKGISQSQEEFNSSMNVVREIFLEMQKQKKHTSLV